MFEIVVGHYCPEDGRGRIEMTPEPLPALHPESLQLIPLAHVSIAGVDGRMTYDMFEIR